MSGFQQDPGELTQDELYGRGGCDSVEEGIVVKTEPTTEPTTESRWRLRYSIALVKQARRITELEYQLSKLCEHLGWEPMK